MCEEVLEIRPCLEDGRGIGDRRVEVVGLGIKLMVCYSVGPQCHDMVLGVQVAAVGCQALRGTHLLVTSIQCRCVHMCMRQWQILEVKRVWLRKEPGLVVHHHAVRNRELLIVVLSQ